MGASPESEIQRQMAGNLPLQNGLEMKIVWHAGANPHALNILHFNNGGGVIDQARANLIDTNVKLAFTSPGLVGMFYTGLSLHHVEVRSMTNNSDPWWIGSGAPVPGTGAGNPLPAATAFVVSLATGLRGRSYNGRVYLAGWTEDANDAAGGITAAGSAAAVAFIDSVRAYMAGAPQLSVLGVLSRFTTPPGSPPGTPATERIPPILTPVTLVRSRDLRWDVQRRRATPGI
jgi:hypothetical protein